MAEEETSIVSEKYNANAALKLKPKTEKTSKIPMLSFHNNWVKSALVQRCCPNRYPCILDLACGKGGDLLKLMQKEPDSVVFADISLESLKVAYDRYRKKGKPFEVAFIHGDCFSCKLRDLIPRFRFHYAHCMFAIHYSFKSEEYARQAIHNLCDLLYSGAQVVLTTVDADSLLEMFKAHRDSRKVENSVFSIERNFELDDVPDFGAEYIFNLVESVDCCPEYLVKPRVIIDLFEENRMELIETKTFPDFQKDVMSDERAPERRLYMRLSKMKGSGGTEMNKEEFEVFSLYRYYIFVKPGTLPRHPRYDRRRLSRRFMVQNAQTGEIHEERV